MTWREAIGYLTAAVIAAATVSVVVIVMFPEDCLAGVTSGCDDLSHRLLIAAWFGAPGVLGVIATCLIGWARAHGGWRHLAVNLTATALILSALTLVFAPVLLFGYAALGAISLLLLNTSLSEEPAR